MDTLGEVDTSKLSLPVRAEHMTRPVLIPRPLLLDEALSERVIDSLSTVDATDGVWKLQLSIGTAWKRLRIIHPLVHNCSTTFHFTLDILLRHDFC